MKKSLLTLGATMALTFGAFTPTNNTVEAATSCYSSYDLVLGSQPITGPCVKVH